MILLVKSNLRRKKDKYVTKLELTINVFYWLKKLNNIGTI